jgi:small subunit ribosomal protein S17
MADKKKKTTEETPVVSAEIEDAVVEAAAEDIEMIVAEVAAVEEAIEEDAVEAVAADLAVGAEAEEAVAEAVAEGAITPEEAVEAVEAIEEAVAEAVAEVVLEAAVAEDAVEEAAAEVIAEELEEAAVVEEALEEAVVEQTTAPAPQSGPKIKKKRLPRALRPQKTRPTRTKPTERKPIVRLEKPEHERGRSQERQGTVVSAAMDKTIVVKVEVTKSHRKYKKVVRRSVKFHAHDEANTAKLGDVVRIVETRPLSATKRWRLAEIVKVAE